MRGKRTETLLREGVITIVAEKPPLDDELLMHFGVKGMRWGHRNPDDPPNKTSTTKKVAIGVGVVAGAAAAAYIISRRGKVPLDMSRKARMQRSVQAGKAFLIPTKQPKVGALKSHVTVLSNPINLVKVATIVF